MARLPFFDGRSTARRQRGRRALRALLGPDLAGAVQAIVALGVLAVASVLGGIALGSASDRLAELPGLLLLVPAAIALRGNILGALGSRLGTAIHAGTFRVSTRPTSLVGQNLIAASVLTLALSAIAAVVARGVAIGFGLEPSMSLADFIVISVVGGVIASIPVAAVAVALAGGSVRYGWDPDSVTAPLVTGAGDVLTLPALLLASLLVTDTGIADWLALALIIVSALSLVAVWRSALGQAKLIVNESLPVLMIAIALDLIAGLTVEKQFDEFEALPALLVLLPGYLAAAGALGGILANRLSTKLHLGLISPAALPPRPARVDLISTLALAVPLFVFTAAISNLAAGWFDLASPGLFDLVAVALLGGLAVTIVVLAVGYYGTIAAVRIGADPDTYGIPLVTSALDLVGAFTLVLAIEALL